MGIYELIQEGKVKRYFRAKKKINVPNLISHITQRAAGKEPLFVEEKDYLFMLGLIKETTQKFALSMYAFCLMPNHVHMLFGLQKDNLYRAMQVLFSRYAGYFNHKYERKGHLFGGPYRQSVCLDDSYLLAASIYVHLNPVKAKLAQDPLDYRWSSCRLYAEDTSPRSFIDNGFILKLLSDSLHRSKEQYRSLLTKGACLEIGEILEQEDSLKSFLSNLANLFPAVFKQIQIKRRLAKSMGIDLLDEDELDGKIKELKERGQMSRPESRKAQVFLIEQLIARGYKKQEIAEKFGLSRKTIYNYLTMNRGDSEKALVWK